MKSEMVILKILAKFFAGANIYIREPATIQQHREKAHSLTTSISNYPPVPSSIMMVVVIIISIIKQRIIAKMMLRTLEVALSTGVTPPAPRNSATT